MIEGLFSLYTVDVARLGSLSWAKPSLRKQIKENTGINMTIWRENGL